MDKETVPESHQPLTRKAGLESRQYAGASCAFVGMGGLVELLTGITPEHEIHQRPLSILSDEAWGKIQASYKGNIRGSRMEYWITVPETEYTYASTLGKVHSYLWGDWGPLYISWRDGALCPFDPEIKYKNMTCCDGRRQHCVGRGLLIRPSDVKHLPEYRQRRLAGRVICYEWCHILGNAYWDLKTDELLQLPDDPFHVAFVIMRRVYQATGWRDWLKEKERRKVKPRREWLMQRAGGGGIAHENVTNLGDAINMDVYYEACTRIVHEVLRG